VLDHVLKAGLEDRNLSIAEALYFGGVIIDADDFVSQIRKASSGDKPHIARANHCDPHVVLPLT
jgi:hypothetical protein